MKLFKNCLTINKLRRERERFKTPFCFVLISILASNFVHMLAIAVVDFEELVERVSEQKLTFNI